MERTIDRIYLWNNSDGHRGGGKDGHPGGGHSVVRTPVEQQIARVWIRPRNTNILQGRGVRGPETKDTNQTGERPGGPAR